MAVFLTQNSPGLRTSPVKRGYWVVQQVLGIRFRRRRRKCRSCPTTKPRPTGRCARCWRSIARCRCAPPATRKFDSFGLAFEGFGPVGDARTKDLAGRPVDTSAIFPGGSRPSASRACSLHPRPPPGPLRRQSQPQAPGLWPGPLAAALRRTAGRQDEPARMGATGYRFGALVETIVTSPQFLNRRLPENAAAKAAHCRKAVKFVKTLPEGELI